jgi:hypothetical protein
MAGRLRGGDGVIETARVQEPVRIQIIWFHPENTGKKEHVVVGDPNLAGLDFADLSPRGVIHPSELQFDRQLVLRLSAPAAQPSDLRSYDVNVPHERVRCMAFVRGEMTTPQPVCDEAGVICDEAGFFDASSQQVRLSQSARQNARRPEDSKVLAL